MSKLSIHIINDNKDGSSSEYYKRWDSMIRRSLAKSYKNRFKSYTDVTVCSEWLVFSNFKKWMEKQDWKGKHLDKDIMHPGNKEYSPDKCLFVSRSLNNLLNDSARSRGKFMLGVHFHKRVNKYQSKIKINGKRKHLGYFDSEQDAHNEWAKNKILYIESFLKNETDIRIISGLNKHIDKIKKGLK